MAWRASLRAEAAEAQRQRQEAAEQTRLAAEFPALPGENAWADIDGPHRGHRTHSGKWHVGLVICSCGAFVGCYSYVLPDEPLEPEPCPVCVARGIPLDGR